MALRSDLSAPNWHECVELFDCAVRLERGCILTTQESEIHERMHAGLKLVVVDGGLRYRGEAMPREEEAVGASAFVMSDDGRHGGSQTFLAGVEQRYLALRLEPQWIAAELGREPHDLHRCLGGADGRPVVSRRQAVRAVRGLAGQILHAPLDGALRRLHLGSQVLALVAHVLEPWMGVPTPGDSFGVRGSELERLHHARRLLLADLRQPPALPQLAAAVGMSLRKLDVGFRRVFGVTPAQCLREQRLQQAWHWLCSGQYQVSEVAWMSGYGFAHFSTVFRRRFGVSPVECGGAEGGAGHCERGNAGKTKASCGKPKRVSVADGVMLVNDSDPRLHHGNFYAVSRFRQGLAALVVLCTCLFCRRHPVAVRCAGSRV